MYNKLKEITGSSIDRILWKTFNRRRPFDFERAAFWRAAVESSEFVEINMPEAENFRTRKTLLTKAIDMVDMDGLWLEFGVHRGDTLRHIATRTKTTVHGFDSFEGLPEDWTPTQRKGRFSLGGNIPSDMPANVNLVKGWFDESLPRFLAENSSNVAFLHIDSDLYSSCKTILSLLNQRIQAGTVIVFDELLNYPGWKNGEVKAWMEFTEPNGLDFKYFGFASTAHSVGVIVNKRS